MANPPDLSPRPSSAFFLWLDELLESWLLPAIAVAVLAVTGILYLLGLASPVLLAALVTGVTSVGAALVMVRPAIHGGGDSAGRALLCAAGLITLIFTTVPALQAILPGAPLFQGDVGEEGEVIAIPAGIGGHIRILVNGKLRAAGDPTIAFRIEGTERPIEGTLDRTIGFARVGRSGRAQVAHDHNSDWYESRLPAGTTELRLTSLRGQPDGRLQISAYRDWLPHSLLWIAALGALLLAAVADARLGMKGNTAVAAGMSLAFGMLVAFNATPAVPVGPALGGVVLGAMVGSIAGALVGRLARRWVPPARRRGAAKVDRKNDVAEA